MKKVAFLFVLMLVLGMALLSFNTQGANTLPVYSDGALADGWDNWSWSSNADFANPDPVHSGTSSIALTYTGGWAGFYLHANSDIDTTLYDTIHFFVHGGATGGQSINVTVFASSSFNVVVPANTWTEVNVKFKDLGAGNVIRDLVFQDATPNGLPTFYIDDIELIASGPPPTPTPSVPVPGPALSINAAAAGRLINPDIYGMNYAAEDLAQDLRLPVRRWGGNSTTRYNWEIDVHNTGSDWFYENIADKGDAPGESSADSFVNQNLRTNTKTIMTMPMIGWVPKARVENHPFDAGFKVSLYGPQKSTDTWDPDCGNGIRPDGTLITGNDPYDTSIEAGPDYVQGWIRHLISRFGSADQGGVQYYNLDNEPSLWNSTHRDVHPQPLGYDELRDRTYQFAAAIKQVDPSAKTLGPVEWGWTAYEYSALDGAPGGAWWENPLDRNAHGGTPLVPWYLQQMQYYELTHGTRILDYLDLHYYPQANNVSLGGAGNAATKALRLRTTRSLWDPTYVDESWINQPVMLIPRMRQWVDQNYPGTKLAISEYNFGAAADINGALAQADVLGIFGREGLDLATLWSPPKFNDPLAFAFRMYRNYDGAGSAFGDLSVSSESVDQGKVSIYTALRRSDGALTIMVVNKTNNDQICPVNLAGFTPAGPAAVYQYSALDLSAIVRAADFDFSTAEYTFASNSITLLVITNGSPLSFDNPNKPWIAGSENVNLVLDSDLKTEGSASLKLEGRNYMVIKSPIFSSQEFYYYSNELSLDVYVPDPQTNPYWIGAVQLYFQAPEAGIYNQYIGQVELTGLEVGAWNTIRFTLPEKIVNLFNGSYSDIFTTIAFNTGHTGEAFRIDNLRFSGDLIFK
ncbi:MAG TPA: glycoside hydrolase family 44 protein [Bacillota bacterium]|nr:glycoside hydrolase family 44 protein [Bacillota bacterium]